jgi:hypothetical protein
VKVKQHLHQIGTGEKRNSFLSDDEGDIESHIPNGKQTDDPVGVGQVIMHHP